VTVLVCESTSPSENDILLGVLHGDDNWTDVVFDEIMKRVDKRRRKKYFLFKYGAAVFTNATATTIAGTAIGAGIGMVAGIPRGLLGMAAGAVLGGATGGGVAAVTSLPLSVIVAVRRWKKRNSWRSRK